MVKTLIEPQKGGYPWLGEERCSQPFLIWYSFAFYGYRRATPDASFWGAVQAERGSGWQKQVEHARGSRYGARLHLKDKKANFTHEASYPTVVDVYDSGEGLYRKSDKDPLP